jgi:hypothetical protein
MKKFKLLMVGGFLCAAFWFLAVVSSGHSLQGEAKKAGETIKGASLPFGEGETIKYAIKKMGMKAGDAMLVFNGKTTWRGKEAYLITFSATALNFFDEEKIYADVETLYPLAVERNLNIWGKKEKITEIYDQVKGIVTVEKTSGEENSKQVIDRKEKVDNIYCFIYRYRISGEFNIGDAFSIRLPTKDVAIELVKKTTLKTAGKNYDAYYMQSDPSTYRVWFDVSKEKVPLRINGAVGFGDTAMTMVAYKEGIKKAN